LLRLSRNVGVTAWKKTVILYLVVGLIILTISGFVASHLNAKAANEIEQRRISNRIAEIERLKAAEDTDETSSEPARRKTRRRR